MRQATRRPEGEPVILASTHSIHTEMLGFFTTARNEFWDLTELTREVVARAGVRHGQVTVHTPHTTTTIVLNESETGIVNDYCRAIDRLIPANVYYEHDDLDVRTENLQDDELVNGPSHVRGMLVGAAGATIPIVGGEVLLGYWQRVLFGELDRARERRVVIHVQGAA